MVEGRRDAMAKLLALAAAGASATIAAQPRELRGIGYLSLEPAPNPYPTPEQWRLRSASVLLRQAGWDEGRTLVIERAYAELDSTILDTLARALITKGVEAIVANGPEAALAAA